MTADEMVDDVMKHFDFDRVLTVMWALGWVYTKPNPDVEGEIINYAPTLADLHRAARHCAEAVAAGGDRGPCSTGGFAAWKYHGRVTLAFVATQWTAE
jgi:hypothetical protein